MLRLQDYAIFNHLQQSGAPLRASTRLGEGLAAALWERAGHGHYRYKPANHHTLSFWVAEGAGFRRLRGRGYDPIHGESSLWVVPADAPTAWEAAGKGRLLHFYIPKPVFEARVVETLDADPSLISLREEGLQRDASLETIIRSIILPLSWEEPADRIAITEAGEMLTTYLAVRCSERAPKALFIRGGLAPVVLRRVKEYVEANLEQDLAIEDLAAVTGLSPYHFARTFKRSTGCGPYAYVLRRRTERAKRLLAAGKMSLSNVAQACGFGSQSHFSARFREATGLTPRQFGRCFYDRPPAERIGI
ncbi:MULTISPECIES: AraC family transcriptional regulator [unclassified Mesorhizobium]|uniref:AraC family transcriptional regulator n=1 Tax=unclassified Mesorhizobium TaxID=325217 RepID=UPI001FEE676B|nr:MULTISPECIES: AraC family transcriptional regulator [unclassified Mesorhizobium]